MSTSRPVPDKRTQNNKLIQQLRQEPCTLDELPYTPSAFHRQYVAKLSFKSASNGAGKARGTVKNVYYLYGDERRAIRRFIEENNEFVHGCMQDDSNPIANRVSEGMWQMFCEEWMWAQPSDE